jgi:hypothetical protein
MFGCKIGHVLGRRDPVVLYAVSGRQPGDYDKEKIGLNHIALGVRIVEELMIIRRN